MGDLRAGTVTRIAVRVLILLGPVYCISLKSAQARDEERRENLRVPGAIGAAAVVTALTCLVSTGE